MLAPDIVTRKEWGAKPPKKEPFKITTPTPKLYLHHAAGAVIPQDDSVSGDDLKRIYNIQSYHMNNRGWSDIAYSFLTDPDGYVFEGRGAGIAGGHTKGQNTVSHAICVMGNYDKQTSTDDLEKDIATIVAWGFFQKWWPDRITGGHRDAPDAATSCPGKNLYSRISTINQLAKEIIMATTRFKDVPETHTHYRAIEWLAANGITSGANPPKNDLFEPFRQVSRGEFATMLKRYNDKVVNKG